jgi:hypothetical protein
MSLHRNAKLGLAGRYALVRAIAGGMTLKAAAFSRKRKKYCHNGPWPLPTITASA